MKTVTKNYMKYFNSLDDAALLALVQDIIDVDDLNRYKVVLRSKTLIRITDEWEPLDIKEDGIWVTTCDPPYGTFYIRVFDKYFCIRLQNNPKEVEK